MEGAFRAEMERARMAQGIRAEMERARMAQGTLPIASANVYELQLQISILCTVMVMKRRLDENLGLICVVALRVS